MKKLSAIVVSLMVLFTGASVAESKSDMPAYEETLHGNWLVLRPTGKGAVMAGTMSSDPDVGNVALTMSEDADKQRIYLSVGLRGPVQYSPGGFNGNKSLMTLQVDKNEPKVFSAELQSNGQKLALALTSFADVDSLLCKMAAGSILYVTLPPIDGQPMKTVYFSLEGSKSALKAALPSSPLWLPSAC